MTAEATWVTSVLAAGGRRDVAESAAADLTRRYGQAHRRYHTVDHVDTVVRDCALLGAEVGLTAPDGIAVALAACAHDVVYDARPAVDEQASAEWARTWLTRATVADGLAERVADLVLATATHVAAPGDVAAATPPDAVPGCPRSACRSARRAARTRPRRRPGRRVRCVRAGGCAGRARPGPR